MKKTKIARDAYENYREKRYLKLTIYWIVLFVSLSIPALIIAYLTDHVNGIFYLAAPFYIYISFPIWFGLYVTSALLADAFARLLGMNSLFGADIPKFSEVTFHLTGFKVED